MEDGDLQTLGLLDYDKRLSQSFTAHPKIDPFTKEMFTFGYSHTPPYVTYGVITKDGIMLDPLKTIPEPVMMHDFTITENYAILMDLFKLLAGMKVYITDEKELIMEPSLKWAGNPNVIVAVKAFGWKATVQLVVLQVFAAPRITLVPSFPCFSKILVSLMEKVCKNEQIYYCVLSGSFTLTNNCAYTVWPGVLSNAGSTPLSATGFSLQKGESKTLPAPSGWAGRFWGRTICKQDSSGKFSCVTGDCSSGTLECAGSEPTHPFTLAEFKLDGADGPDFYDVSLVDGYNLPMLVVPQGGSGNCIITGCSVDLNRVCPSDLRLSGEDGRETVGCLSPCDAFGDPQYCCSGDYGNPNTCKPTPYSEFFKHACPRARSYAYDDGTSTFTCASADYVITFCPLISTSQNALSSGSSHPQAADPLPLVNRSTVSWP